MHDETEEELNNVEYPEDWSATSVRESGTQIRSSRTPPMMLSPKKEGDQLRVDAPAGFQHVRQTGRRGDLLRERPTSVEVWIDEFQVGRGEGEKGYVCARGLIPVESLCWELVSKR